MMLKVRFSILYKSGHEDVIEQIAKEEEIDNTNQETMRAFKEDVHGTLTFGDSEKTGYFVRVKEVARLKCEILEVIEEGVLN